MVDMQRVESILAGHPGAGRDHLIPILQEVQEAVSKVDKSMFAKEYGVVFEGDERWKALPSPTVLSAQIDPPSSSADCLAMARPSPEPL